MGVRDNNELSWTQVLEIVEFMSDATTIPIMLDSNTGYGNFNNMRRLVRKLEQRNIAAVCIEDKLFPKTNSFIASERQPLTDIEEFSGKIKSGKGCAAGSRLLRGGTAAAHSSSDWEWVVDTRKAMRDVRANPARVVKL